MGLMVRLIPLMLLLAACEPAENLTSPDGATMNESKAVDDAAAMLNARDRRNDDLATATTTKAKP